jgi:hypothetical protein
MSEEERLQASFPQLALSRPQRKKYNKSVKLKKLKNKLGVVVHACNPGYSGGRILSWRSI